MHEKLVKEYINKFSNDSKLQALLLTGSVARGEHTSTSDLDLIAVGDYEPKFVETTEDKITVEIKYRSLDSFLEEMTTDSINCYQFLDAKLLCGDQTVLDKLVSHANETLKDYKAVVPEKWLRSAKEKIIAAKGDDMKVSFLVANNLWKLVEGIYAVNSLPVPPMTTAYRNITTLQMLPENFARTWEALLLGNVQARTEAFSELVDFALSK